MADLSHSRTIATDIGSIWEVLADFGSLSAWADGIDHSCLLGHGGDADPLGMTRRVQIGRDTFVEEIVAFAPPRLLAYDVSGVPRGMSVSNRWKLRSDSAGRTTVTLTSTVGIGPRPWGRIAERLAARGVAKRSQKLLASLATTCEERQ